MTVEKIGLNFSALNNIEPLNVSEFIPNTVDGFIENIPVVANELTYGYFGLVIMTILFLYLLIAFSDKTEFGGFRYSSIRAVGIAAGICGVTGSLMINFGYFVVWYHVVIFMVISFICTAWVYLEEK